MIFPQNAARGPVPEIAANSSRQTAGVTPSRRDVDEEPPPDAHPGRLAEPGDRGETAYVPALRAIRARVRQPRRGGMMRTMTNAPWHDDPELRDRFHPQHPNDLEVLVHDGEPRRSGRGPEGCWVSVRGVRQTLRFPVAPADAAPPLRSDAVRWVERRVYEGVLLNQPNQLTTARKGDTVLFVTSPGVPHPVRVTEDYVRERGWWSIQPCNSCGADQALDPPTQMARTRFPDAPAGATPVAFSAFCPCGGTMLLALVEDAASPAEPPEPPARKPWWKFW